MIFLTQKQTFALAALVFGALCAVLLLIPGLIAWLFSMELTTSAAIFARRAALLFSGLARIAWGARKLEAGEASRMISLAFAVSMGGLALLGLAEFIAGRVGPGIFLAIATELLFTVHFAHFAKTR